MIEALEDMQAKERTEPPAVQLDDAMNDVDALAYDLMGVIEKITGQSNREAGNDAPRPVPTLQDVLNIGPTRLRESVQNAKDKIDEIERLLF